MRGCRLFNLTVLEMCVGGIQFLSGIIVITYSFLLLAHLRDDAAVGSGSGAEVSALSRYFDMGDGECELGSLCFEPTVLIIALRLIKVRPIPNFSLAHLGLFFPFARPVMLAVNRR